MNSKRRHIGPAHTPYPAKVAGEKIGFMIFKIIAALACSALWSIAYYIILNVVAVIASGGSEDPDALTVDKMLNTVWGKWVWIIVALIVFVSVLRSKIGSHNKRDPKNERKLV